LERDDDIPMTRKRSKEEMCEAILKEAMHPKATISAINEFVGLAWGSSQELIPKLRSAGLLLVKDGAYITTARGEEYIEARKVQRELLKL
jgi:predicted transcriptional regulator